MPQELVPTEDRGVFFVSVTAPQGATVELHRRRGAPCRGDPAAAARERRGGTHLRRGRDARPGAPGVRGRPPGRLGRARAEPAGDHRRGDARDRGAARRAGLPIEPGGAWAARQPHPAADRDRRPGLREHPGVERRDPPAGPGEPGPAQRRDRLRAQPAAVRRPDRPAQGRRSRHRRRDHRPDAADHARVARDHHLRRSRPRISGDRAGAGGRPADPDRSRQHLRARREQRRAGAAHGPGPAWTKALPRRRCIATTGCPRSRSRRRSPAATISARRSATCGRSRPRPCRPRRASASTASRASSSIPPAASRSPSRSRC